jgi:Flp pilus assembly protein protease CpaA
MAATASSAKPVAAAKGVMGARAAAMDVAVTKGAMSVMGARDVKVLSSARCWTISFLVVSLSAESLQMGFHGLARMRNGPTKLKKRTGMKRPTIPQS